MLKSVLFAAMLASPVAAQTVCLPYDIIAAELAKRHGETPGAIGVAGNGMLMTIWINPETGSYTVTMSGGDGTTCAVSSGENFETVSAVEPTGAPT